MMQHRTPSKVHSAVLDRANPPDLSAQQRLALCREELRDILIGHIGEGPVLDLCLSTVIIHRTQVFQALRKTL